MVTESHLKSHDSSRGYNLTESTLDILASYQSRPEDLALEMAEEYFPPELREGFFVEAGASGQCSPLSLVEECRGSTFIGRELHSVAPPALLCHKEPARSKQRPVGSLRSKAPSWGLWMPELVLYDIRELAEHHYDLLTQ